MTKQYHFQNYPIRNMSRDYNKILEYAHEEKCKWVWLIDFDEYIPEIELYRFKGMLLNCKSDCVSFPLFEMRGDINHYIMVKDMDGSLKHARKCHKCYKVLPHTAYTVNDEHSAVIPDTCLFRDEIYWFPILHLGHMTKNLREEKRKMYSKDMEEFGYDDKGELQSNWLTENEEELEIKKYDINVFKNPMEK